MKKAQILAAGVVMWNGDPQRPKVAVIHRPKYDDWSLPKGKLERGEDFEQAAVREVREETGLEAQLMEKIGDTVYEVGGQPKRVVFFSAIVKHLTDFSPTDEVDELLWLSPRAAVRKLDHEDQRRLLEAEWQSKRSKRGSRNAS